MTWIGLREVKFQGRNEATFSDRLMQNKVTKLYKWLATDVQKA